MNTPENTIHKDEPSNRIEWVITPSADPKSPKPVEFKEALVDLLQPYEAVDYEKDSDVQYSTPELIQALEEHLGIMQGDSDIPGIDAADLVNYMLDLGFKRVNTGGLTLEWLLKKKAMLV